MNGQHSDESCIQFVAMLVVICFIIYGVYWLLTFI
jgi:hypothetical protein